MRPASSTFSDLLGAGRASSRFLDTHRSRKPLQRPMDRLRAMNAHQASPGGRADPRSEDGFTLIEVVVTAIVIALVMGATLGALQAAGRAGGEQRHQTEAYALAQKDQARMRGMQISQLDGLDEARNVTVGDSRYTVSSTGEFVNDVTGTASCEEGTNSSDYLSITSTVTWPSIGTRPPTVIKSIVAPPNGSIDEDTGELAVVVRNAAGEGIPDFSMSGNGAGTFSGSTGPTGCVLFTDLAAGNYTLTPSGSSGTVDPDGNPPGPIATSVVGQSTNTVVLRYDTPGTIRVAFTTRINGSVTATKGDAVVAYNSGMSAPASFGTVGTRIDTLDITSRFPFTSPYGVYAGSCATNNPNPDDVENPPAAAAIADVTVTANQTENGTIQLPALDLTVRSGNSSGNPGSLVQNGTVKITDTDCTVGGNPVKRTYTTTTTAAPGGAGKLAAVGAATVPTPGMPYGVYDICASNGTRRNTATDVAVQTTTTNTTRTIYLGSGASGSSAGTCP